MSGRGKRKHDSHARIYEWERRCGAYQSLSCTARALLVEFRLLYNGRENRIPMSVREAAQRLGVSTKPASAALKELQDRGFIWLIQRGSFSTKVRLASVYALTSEPVEPCDGTTAPKDYMRWRKTTVVDSPTDGRRFPHRGPSSGPDERSHGRHFSHRERHSGAPHGSHFSHTVKLPSEADADGGEEAA